MRVHGPLLREVTWWEGNGCAGLLSLRSINPFEYVVGRLGRIDLRTYLCSRRVDAKYAGEGRYESEVGLSSCTYAGTPAASCLCERSSPLSASLSFFFCS